MKKQIMKIAHKGRAFTVIYDDQAEINQYALYRHIYEPRRDMHGMAEHKLLAGKYANLASILCVLESIPDYQ